MRLKALKLIFFIFFSIHQLQSKEVKTLILIIASDNHQFYKELQKVWLSYMDLDPVHFDCYFIKSDENINSLGRIVNSTIWTSGVEQVLLPGVLNKTIASLEVLENKIENYDYIIRTNLSSFYIFVLY